MLNLGYIFFGFVLSDIFTRCPRQQLGLEAHTLKTRKYKLSICLVRSGRTVIVEQQWPGCWHLQLGNCRVLFSRAETPKQKKRKVLNEEKLCQTIKD